MQAEEYKLMEQVEEKHWWFVARRAILSTMLKRLDLPPNAQIMEIGCGTGGNLQMLAGFGEVYAVEPNENAYAISVQKQQAADYTNIALPQHPFPGKSFDLIVLFDSLEHMKNDREALQAIKPSLKENGTLFITVPAFPFLWSDHDVALHHYRRYTRGELHQIVKENGYKTTYSSYFNFWLFPLIAIIRLVQKYTDHGQSEQTARSNSMLPGFLMNKLLQAVFASERWLIGRIKFPFGVSLMLVATKS